MAVPLTPSLQQFTLRSCRFTYRASVHSVAGAVQRSKWPRSVMMPTQSLSGPSWIQIGFICGLALLVTKRKLQKPKTKHKQMNSRIQNHEGIQQASHHGVVVVVSTAAPPRTPRKLLTLMSLWPLSKKNKPFVSWRKPCSRG